MAQLRDSIVQGSLRVTDTTYTNNLIISNTTAPTIATNDYLIIADASDGNKLLKGPSLNTSNTTKWLTQAGTWTTPTASNVGLGNVSNNSNLNGTTGTKGDMIYWSDTNTPARLGIGTATHLLVATASGPRWSANAHINDTSSSSTTNQANELVLGNSTASTSNGSSFGRLALYSENTAGTRLVSASGTAWKTATLQAKDGTIAYTADITSAIQALDVTAITGSASKTLTSISETDGKISATYSDISIGAGAIASGTVANARLPARLQEYHTTATNTDTTFTSGWHYSDTNSPFTKYHSANKDFMVWAHAHTASKWGSEIATDFRTNRIAVRNINNGTWNSWKELGSFTGPVNEYTWTNDIIYDDIENQFTLTRTTNGWASQIYSKHGFADGCYVSFRPVDNTHHIMIGLNSDPTTDANWEKLDYVWYMQNNGNLDIRESKTTVQSITGHTTYAANDDFRIEYSNGYIRYYHNGVLCRTVARAISGQLYLDSSFYNGGSIKDLRFGPIKNINLVSKDAPGLVPKGAAVSSQSTSTKFLREDGSWAAPSYIANAAYGNLSTAGKITTAITLATDDFLIIGDNSDGGKIGKGPAFNTSNTTKWLTQAGTWTTPTAANVGAATSDHTQAVNKGGTNITSYTKGDILYASAATTLSKLAISATEGAILNVASGIPAWTTNYTANELVWYANSATNIYYYITTDYAVTNEKWFYGTITGSRGGAAGSFIVSYNIHTNSSGTLDGLTFYDPTLQIGTFRAHKDASNKLIISFTINNRYSRMRMKTYVDNSGSYYNYARSVTTTAPTVSTTYTGLREQNFTFPAHEIYWGGMWNSNTGNAGIAYQDTNGDRGIQAFRYPSFPFGNHSFGLQSDSIIIETTKDGTTWTTESEAGMYTADYRRRVFNFRERQIPVHGGLAALDYWNRSSDGVAFTAADGTTHYSPPTKVGSGVRITADFTGNARYFYFDTIETRWYAVPDACLCTIESYNRGTDTWTTLFSGTYTNSDTRRFYTLGRNAYVRGNHATNTSYIAKLRWTIKITTKNTNSDNRRYVPSITAINLYGLGKPTFNTGRETRFAQTMAQNNSPIYVTSYDYCGAASIPVSDLYIGDDLKTTAANTEKWSNVHIGNSMNISVECGHSQGRIYLYSAATQAHIIVGTSTTTAYTHTFPNDTGMIVSLSGSTAKGSGTKPVYVPATGIVTECSTYAGGTAVTLNNASKAASTASFYAPTAGGTVGHILIGAGTTTAPAWNGALTLGGTAAANYTATIHGKLIGSSYNYGTTLPSSPTTGQIFFQTTDTTTFVKNSGDTMTGELIFTSPNALRLSYASNHSVIFRTDDTSFWLLLSNSRAPGDNYILPAAGHPLRIDYSTGYSYFSRAYGAVWNDYAEFRRDNIQEKDKQKPGHCVYELGDGTLALTTKRLQYGCEIISDTYGFAIGQDKNNGYDTPIASSGRVLAYPYEGIEEFNKHIGKPVCSGPNGTVSIMSEEEECKYPSCIIGTISEIPSYEEWGSAKVKVDGRVWIRVR